MYNTGMGKYYYVLTNDYVHQGLVWRTQRLQEEQQAEKKFNKIFESKSVH